MNAHLVLPDHTRIYLPCVGGGLKEFPCKIHRFVMPYVYVLFVGNPPDLNNLALGQVGLIDADPEDFGFLPVILAQTLPNGIKLRIFEEKREMTRSSLGLKAEITRLEKRSQGGAMKTVLTSQCRTVDMSETGVMVRMQTPVEPKTVVVIRVFRDSGETLFVGSGVIRHCEPRADGVFHVGILITNIAPQQREALSLHCLAHKCREIQNMEVKGKG